MRDESITKAADPDSSPSLDLEAPASFRLRRGISLMSKFLCLYITAPSYEVAEIIGRILVEERLVACVNIIARARSIYRWEGKVETADEVVLIAKGQSDFFKQIKNRVRELHPYECPCIVAWPIEVGHQPYLEWLTRETSAGT